MTVKFKWVEEGNDFILQVESGRAVISQKRDRDNRTVFECRVEDDNGKVLRKWVDTFREFEQAQSFAKYALSALDMPDPDDHRELVDLAKLEAMLDYCLSILPPTYPEAHRTRLRLIRQWVRARRDQYLRNQSGPSIDWGTYQFDWHHEKNQSTAETPYGRLTMYATSSGFPYIRLHDPSGVEYDDGKNQLSNRVRLTFTSFPMGIKVI